MRERIRFLGERVRRWRKPLAACLVALACLERVAGAADAPDKTKYFDHSKVMIYRDDQGRERTVANRDEWAVRRRQILAGMQEAMGSLPSRAALPSLDVKTVGETRGDGFRRITLSFVAERGDRVPADLYLPDRPDGGARSPAILALHQTGALGKKMVAGEGPYQDQSYGLELARRGYVVLAPDYPSFGDYPYDFQADRYVSGSMKGVFNHMRGVDLLQSRPEVDPERIGVIGHSLGGHNAMFVAAFDERIKVVVSSCGWTPFHDYYGGKLKGWTSDRYMPRLDAVYKLDPDRVPFDFYEVVAALAPRPFLSVSPIKDANFDVGGVRKGITEARKAYQLFDAADRLQALYPDCGHSFPTEMRRTSYEFIDKALKQVASHVSKDELPRIPPKSPAEALASFRTLPGFKIELAAAEPLVRDPVAAAFDENGRLYVVEMIDYSEQANEHLGEVRLLEDADGDGRFDKSALFAGKLSWPTAIACWDGGVFVAAAPDVWYFKDTDGDGKADVRKVAYTGFNRSNVQGLVNSFQWGLDNRIHGATSTSGATVRRPDVAGFVPVSLFGRDFSFDPRTLDLRPVSGGGQHGMSLDDWGRKFLCSNSDHIQVVMYEDRYVARNPYLAAPSAHLSIAADGPQAEVYRISPVEPWRIARTRLRVAGIVPGLVEGGGRAAGYFTGATGTTIYRGDAFPPEYRGQAFVGDVGSNIVHRKVLEPDGVGLIARRGDDCREFVASTDVWFRPVQFANAPDGALYVLDMYREVIEHPASLPPEIKQHLDLTSGRDRGRIYRIVPEGFKQPKPPRLGSASALELTAALESRNGWTRDTAARLLYERQDRSAVPVLETLAAGSKWPESRMHAMYALMGLKALNPAIVLSALGDVHPRVREHAVRLAETVVNDAPELRKKLLEMTGDADPRVRYQLAFSLGELRGEDHLAALIALAKKDAGDPWMRLAVMSSLAEGAGRVLNELLKDVDFRKAPAARELISALALQMGMRGKPEEAASVLKALASLTEPDNPLALALVRNLTEGLTRSGSPLKTRLFAAGSAPEKILGTLLRNAGETAADPKRSLGDRIEAARALSLGTFADGRDVLAGLLGNRQPQELQTAAVGALGRFSDPAVGEMLVKAWPTFSPGVRASASEAIFSRGPWLLSLLDAVEKGAVARSDLDPTRLQSLANHADEKVRQRAVAILGKLQRGNRQAVLDSYKPALALKGDPGRGKATFQKSCATCHRLEGVGYEIGPSLAAIKTRGAEAVLLNVLDPNREVNPQYVNYLCATKDGRSVTGMIAAESASSVTLKRAENATETILRVNIEELRSSGASIMPEGLEKDVGVQAMSDLIAYLMAVQ